ncbi:MAG TPA: hypothetical protein VNH11_31535 [Pirellulales bacterium]|nr:hypothetical protein [Pirellulales bacterium]
MTVHIAASLRDGSEAVIFSDSQASSAVDEYHGEQKLYAGSDFVVGCAGSVSIIRHLFEVLHATPHVAAGNVANFIEEFLRDEVRPAMHSELHVLLLTDGGGNCAAIRQFSPDTFTRFGGRVDFCSIGSGADFVYRAIGRDSKNGIAHALSSLTDLILAAENLAEAANESLTVDDLHLVGLLRHRRSYLMGHRAVPPQFAVQQLLDPSVWTKVSNEFEQLLALVKTIRSEVSIAQGTASLIKTSSLQVPNAQQLLAASHAVGLTRAALQSRIDAYCAWYDALLGR